jgi:phospholipid-translocating ATPase
MIFQSALFWFGLLFTIIVSLAPRYIAKAIKFGYFPDDLDIMRYNRKLYPGRDLARDAHMEGALETLRAPATRSSRMASRTDMASGMRSIHRGFDFITEENGVAIRRIQTNLSERRQSNLNLRTPHARKRTKSMLHNIRKSMRRKKPPTPEDENPPSLPPQ